MHFRCRVYDRSACTCMRMSVGLHDVHIWQYSGASLCISSTLQSNFKGKIVACVSVMSCSHPMVPSEHYPPSSVFSTFWGLFVTFCFHACFHTRIRFKCAAITCMLPSFMARFMLNQICISKRRICGCCMEMYIVAQNLKIIDQSVFFISRCQFPFYIGSIT